MSKSKKPKAPRHSVAAGDAPVTPPVTSGVPPPSVSTDAAHALICPVDGSVQTFGPCTVCGTVVAQP